MFHILLRFAGIDIILAIYLQNSIKQTNTNKQTHKAKKLVVLVKSSQERSGSFNILLFI